MKYFSIAVDGPAGAGKSTIAKEVARRLGIVYVDTGAMYRTMALYCLRQSMDPEDEAAIAQACSQIEVSLKYENGSQQVILNGENVTGLIRTEEVGKMASAISVYLPVRKKMVELQQQLAARENVIMDGRDIGTCVLPDAPVKIYLTASVKVRAKRRYQELLEKGISCRLEEIEKDIEDRDWKDMHRQQSPLRQAEDARLLDSSEKTVSQVVEEIIGRAKEAGFEVAR